MEDRPNNDSPGESAAPDNSEETEDHPIDAPKDEGANQNKEQVEDGEETEDHPIDSPEDDVNQNNKEVESKNDDPTKDDNEQVEDSKEMEDHPIDSPEDEDVNQNNEEEEDSRNDSPDDPTKDDNEEMESPQNDSVDEPSAQNDNGEMEKRQSEFLAESSSENLKEQKEDSTHESATAGATKIKPFTKSMVAQSNWAKAATEASKLVMADAVTRKVKMENKVGVAAADLDDDDVLKVIALSLQRAVRDFGKMTGPSMSILSPSGRHVDPKEAEENLEGKAINKDALEYSAVEKGSGKYSVYQPQFACANIHGDEFDKIRAAFGVTNREYYSTVSLQEHRDQSNYYVISSKDAAGKSVSFFFLSPEQRFIFKLCTKKDVESVGKIIGDYRKHIESCCKGGKPSTTLLPRVYGMCSLQFADDGIPDVVMIAQANFFAASYKIHKKFDLKGSTHGRRASEKERTKKSPVFKDLDWIDEERRLRFPSRDQMDDIRDQLNKDTLFLSKCQLIDYSLLVGVHEINKSQMDLYRHSREPFRVVKSHSDRDGTISYFGLVDVLTPYTARKKAETLFTGTLVCCRDVSCQPPTVYQKRFMRFCDENILACDGTSELHVLAYGDNPGQTSKDEEDGA